jgi:hypothetical protein
VARRPEGEGQELQDAAADVEGEVGGDQGRELPVPPVEPDADHGAPVLNPMLRAGS